MFQIKLSINGMRCGQCEAHVKRQLETIDGASLVKASHIKNEAIILSPRSIGREEFEQALASSGYRVEGYQAEEKPSRGFFYKKKEAKYLASKKSSSDSFSSI